MITQPTTRFTRLTSAAIPVRVVFAAIAAIAVDLIVLAIATLAGTPMLMPVPGAAEPIRVNAVAVATAIALPLLLAGGVLWLAARRWPRLRRPVAVAGLVFALLSVAAPLFIGPDFGTKIALATMHAVAGLSWFAFLYPGTPESSASGV